jgi:predicted lipoprotein
MAGHGANVRKWIVRIALVGAAAALLYRFPLFRVVRLQEVREKQAEEIFQPAEFAQGFWNGRLLNSLDDAIDATTLMTAVREDVESAKARYAQALGIGSVYCYFIRGKGRINTIEDDSVGVCLAGKEGPVDVIIATGLIFGNAIRDGSGLIDVNQFPNSQDFNRVSEEINRIVESQVLPPFREQVALGAAVEFVGCAEIIDEGSDLDPLRVVPIVLKLP